MQDIELKFFSQLESGDVLFIDSSHTVKIGAMSITSSWKCCRVLSQGLSYTCTISSCFLITGAIGCWMSFAFDRAIPAAGVLAFNSEFEVLMANSYLNRYHQNDLQAAFPDLPRWIGGSFWMRRHPIAGLSPSQMQNDAAAATKA